MFKEVIFVISILFFTSILFAQDTDWEFPKKYLQGYGKSLKGQVLQYHSPDPDVNTSLLVRSLSSDMYIEWETGSVPENFNEEYAVFLWMFGIDINTDVRKFDLYVNKKKWFTFKTPVNDKKRVWSFKNDNGSELKFRATLLDKYADLMGFATLKVPSKFLIKGKPLTLKVIGETAGSRVWYMTFESSVKEKFSIKTEDLIFKGKSGGFQSVRFNFFHVGKNIEGSVSLIPGISEKFILKPGFNSIQVRLPSVEKPKEHSAKVKISGRPEIIKKFTVKPVGEWTVYFVMHTHTDIGYTRRQSEILPEHLRFIDYALDFCDRTDDYPDNSKFKWTCEASWPVREYLKSRPADQIKRLKKRVEEGRIEITGMFFNMSEILDEAAAAYQLEPVKVCRDFGIPVKIAMQNDVNGIAWCLTDYFDTIGIKYLVMGEHGHRALIPFDKPTAFWWESPSGKRILAYRPEHYMYGNFLGIHTGKFEEFETNLMNYLSTLGEKKYPFDRISMQFSGYMTDNSPPGLTACEIVRKWNEKFEWPRLKIATASEFMEYVEENHADELSVHRAAWPDWWTDGFGSAARETAAARKSQTEILAYQGLFTIASLMGAEIPEDIYKEVRDIQDNILFYDEHTFGAAESVRDPMVENSEVQWSEKAAYVWDAAKKLAVLREKAMGLIQPFLSKSDVPTITFFNTLNWTRSGLAEVYIDHELLPNDKKFRIVDAEGNNIHAQALNSRQDGTYWGVWVEDIPALGFKTYGIQVSDSPKEEEKTYDYSDVFENDFYRIVIDPGSGTISSLIDKQLNMELIDPNSQWKMGQIVYERLSNREQLESFKLEKAWRTTPEGIKTGKIVEGPVWKSIRINGKMPECMDERGVDYEIRLYHKEKRIELVYDMIKLPILEPEGVYIAFPFDIPGGQLVFEAQGGMVKPGKDQLEGTASDWNTVQNFAVVRSKNGQIIFGSGEIPLVHFGNINTGKFQYISKPESTHIFSWVLNNYWTTNFKAYQSGELKWRYFITSDSDNSNNFASKFGWGSRVPIFGRILPAGKNAGKISEKSLLDMESEGIILVSSMPARDKKGILLHMREVDGKKKFLEFKENIDTVYETDVFGKEIRKMSKKIEFQPYEIKFLRIEKR